MKVKRQFWMALGFIGLILGAIGAAVPLLPCVPFLLLAAYSFSRSSQKLYDWFVTTNLYKNNLESYVKGEGMKVQTKIKVIITITFLMGFGFFMMIRKNLYLPCAILAVVWIVHIYYFIFKVKTYKPIKEIENKDI